MKTATILALSMLVVFPGYAQAETDYFGGDAPEQKISFRLDKSRSTKERIILASLFAGTAIFGGMGLYYHLDSRSKSNTVEAVGDHTGLIYDDELDRTYDQAKRSRRLAIGSYCLGGLFLAGAAVALYLTEPGSEVVAVDDSRRPPAPVVPVTLLVTEDSWGIGGGWRF